MDKLTSKHWTARSTKDYLHRVASDFTRIVEAAMGDSVSQSELARRLGVSEGRVSQVLNNPGNFTLKMMIEYARALGLKLAVVGYDDHDPENRGGPIPAEIFAKSWERLGAPRDFVELDACGAANIDIYFRQTDGTWRVPVVPGKRAITKISRSPSTDRLANTGNDFMPIHSFVGT